jgi:lipopolysaccharide export system protein LptC
MTFTNHARHWLLPLPFLGLLGVTYWLNMQAKPELAKSAGSVRHDPDAIVENFSATRLNDQGSPRFLMVAKKMQHFPDDDSTTLDSPRLTALSVEHPPVHITANQGSITSKGDEIFLRGNVEVVREASAQQDSFTLTTEYLHVLPNRDFISSNRAVTMVEARNTIRATGLEMDIKASTIKLLSRIRSEYVPDKK